MTETAQIIKECVSLLKENYVFGGSEEKETSVPQNTEDSEAPKQDAKSGTKEKVLQMRKIALDLIQTVNPGDNQEDYKALKVYL